MGTRKSYPSDVTDDEWALVAPYLTLLCEGAGQRAYALRDVFDALRGVIRTGAQWRYLPGDFPPLGGRVPAGPAVARGPVLRAPGPRPPGTAPGRGRAPPVPDRRHLGRAHLPSTPESGARAGFDGHQMRHGSKVHIAVDTLGHLLALRVTTGKEQERNQVADLAADVQQATGQTVTLAYADQGHTGDQPVADAAAHGITLQVLKPDRARKAKKKKGFVLLPRRWVVERSFAWMSRFRRLARDYERLTKTLAGWHWVAFLVLMLHRCTQLTT